MRAAMLVSVVACAAACGLGPKQDDPDQASGGPDGSIPADSSASSDTGGFGPDVGVKEDSSPGTLGDCDGGSDAEDGCTPADGGADTASDASPDAIDSGAIDAGAMDGEGGDAVDDDGDAVVGD